MKSHRLILEQELEIAEAELRRPALGLLVSGLLAGVGIGTSLLGAALLLTASGGELGPSGLPPLMAIAYGAGFVVVILARTDLFTEYSTIAILPVLFGRSSVLRLARLWILIYVANLVGAAAFAAALAALGPALGAIDPAAFGLLAHSLADHPPPVIFGSAALTGWLMGLLAWLVVAARDTIGQIVVVWLIAAVLGLGHLHHTVIGSAEVLAGLFAGQGIAPADFGRFLLWTSLGNAAGGVLFAVLIRYSMRLGGEGPERGARASRLIGRRGEASGRDRIRARRRGDRDSDPNAFPGSNPPVVRALVPFLLPLALLPLVFLSCAPGDGERDEREDAARAPGKAAERGETGPERTRTEMRNVNLRLGEGMVLHIEYLAGRMVAREQGQPVVLDDKHAYVLHIDTARSAASYERLSALLDRWVFGYEGAPLDDLEVERVTEEGETRLRISGNLTTLGGAPFEVEGVPRLTDDGEIRMEADAMRTVGIEVGGLLDLFGVEGEDIVEARRERGIRIEEDTFIITPARMLPPPEARGHLVDFRMEADSLVLFFGSGDSGTEAAGADTAGAEEGNYLRYRGGTSRIGRLTMTDTDITVADLSPETPFHFDIDRMHLQLNAGHVELRPHGGLVAFAAGYDAIGFPDRPPEADEEEDDDEEEG